jgi:F-type H+-transporting ATPase subunit b
LHLSSPIPTSHASLPFSGPSPFSCAPLIFKVSAMSLSRFAPTLRAQPSFAILQLRAQPSFAILQLREQHAAAPLPPAPLSTGGDKPGFFKKIVLRFQGTPLPGEAQKPKSMFDGMGQEYVAPPLPPMPKDFKEHPDRDLVNFPYPVKQQYPPKTRFLMIPDSWCTPFHKVTGTSGPYLFFGGVFAFYLNKELWVFEEQGHLLVGWILFYLLASRTVSYNLDKWADGKYRERMDYYKQLITDDLKDAIEFRKTSAAESASFQAVQSDFPTILRENLALQLEATYRTNVEKIASELKRRLDYLKEVEETKQRFERELFMKALLDGVKRSVDTNEGNIKGKYLDTCISQIGQLKL